MKYVAHAKSVRIHSLKKNKVAPVLPPSLDHVTCTPPLLEPSRQQRCPALECALSLNVPFPFLADLPCTHPCSPGSCLPLSDFELHLPGAMPGASPVSRVCPAAQPGSVVQPASCLCTAVGSRARSTVTLEHGRG